MRARRLERNSGSAERDDSQAFYVYCIGESEPFGPLFEAELPEAIESTAGLELVGEGNLAAVVSAVPRADYGTEGLDIRLADPSWMALRAMRHERVAEHFASRTSLVPLRFGTIYFQRDAVRRMLAEKRTELLAIIERLRGREEWGVNILSDRGRLIKAVASLSPRLRELAEQAANAPPGQSYLVKKKIDAMRAAEAGAEGRRVIAEVERELKAVSDGAVRLRVLKEETGENNVAAKLALLVARTRFAEFRETAGRLAEEFGPLGFQLELTGPWPAYNFAAGEI